MALTISERKCLYVLEEGQCPGMVTDDGGYCPVHKAILAEAQKTPPPKLSETPRATPPRGPFIDDGVVPFVIGQDVSGKEAFEMIDHAMRRWLEPTGDAEHLKLSVDDETEMDYVTLRRVLERAYTQASAGKGKERHSSGEPFDRQQIVQFGRWQRNISFNTGQAAKKAFEAERLPKERAVSELLGAIVYLAGAVIIREEMP